MLSSDSSIGVLIIGHGTRDKRGILDFFETVRQIRSQFPTIRTEAGYLELASPTIAEGVESLLEKGVSQIFAVPLLLFAAGHVRQDIPNILAGLSVEHGSTEICQLPHLGCAPAIVHLSAYRYREALAPRPYVPPEGTRLILVGRGSGDQVATQEMYQFAELRHREAAAGSMRVCFLAVQSPALRDALWEAGEALPERVVIQPHLLFSGDLSRQIQAEVEVARARWPASDWVVTEPLGPHPLLADAVKETVLTALQRQNPSGPAAVSEEQTFSSDRVTGDGSDLVPGGLSG